MLWPDLMSYSNAGLFILRFVVGVIFLYHAMPKLKNPKGMAAMLGKPSMAWFPFLMGILEFAAGISLILGIYLQAGALVIAVIMFGATMMKMFKWKTGFAPMDKVGWEFDLVLLAAALVLLFGGGGSILMLL